MTVMQQAGYRAMDPDVASPDLERADITPSDGTLNTIRLRNVQFTTPAMSLNPAAVTAAYSTILGAPGAGGVAVLQDAIVPRTGGTNGNGRDPRPDEWLDLVAGAIRQTATHWRLRVDVQSGNSFPDNLWNVNIRNNTWPALVGLWGVHGSRLVARGTFDRELIGDEETLTFSIDPGQVYHILSGGLIDWTADVAVRDRIFITFAAWDEAASSLNHGVYTIKEIVDADNVIVYEPFEAGGPTDFNVLLVQKANA